MSQASIQQAYEFQLHICVTNSNPRQQSVRHVEIVYTNLKQIRSVAVVIGCQHPLALSCFPVIQVAIE